MGVVRLGEEELGQMGPGVNHRHAEVLDLRLGDDDSDHDDAVDGNNKPQRKRVTIALDYSEENHSSYDSGSETENTLLDTPTTPADTALHANDVPARKRSHIQSGLNHHLEDDVEEEVQPEWNRIMPASGATGLQSERYATVTLTQAALNPTQRKHDVPVHAQDLSVVSPQSMVPPTRVQEMQHTTETLRRTSEEPSIQVETPVTPVSPPKRSRMHIQRTYKK